MRASVSCPTQLGVSLVLKDHGETSHFRPLHLNLPSGEPVLLTLHTSFLILRSLAGSLRYQILYTLIRRLVATPAINTPRFFNHPFFPD